MAEKKKELWEQALESDDPNKYQTALQVYQALNGSDVGSSVSSTPSYTNQYQQQIQDLTNKYMNRGEFSYDPNTDPDYQNYLAQYTRNGETAMNNTLAQVLARTGGLASSYATQASQGVYDDYMKQVSDLIPTLRQAAYEKYQQEGSDILNQLNLYNTLENQDYSRYQDQLNNTYQQQQFAYQQQQDAIANQLAQDQFAYQQEQDEIANKLAQDKFNYDKYQDSLSRSDALTKAALEAEGTKLDPPNYYDSDMVDRFKEMYQASVDDVTVTKKNGKIKSVGTPNLEPMLTEIKSFVASNFGAYDSATQENICYQYAKAAGLSEDELKEWFGTTSTLKVTSQAR